MFVKIVGNNLSFIGTLKILKIDHLLIREERVIVGTHIHISLNTNSVNVDDE